ncbi:MAG: GMP synthase [Chloroflexota bacterium]
MSKTLGILNACSPEEEEEFQSSEFQNFVEFLDTVDHPFELIEYRITEGEFPKSAQDCDAFLITGSPKGVYDDEPWIEELGTFIRGCYAEEQKMVGVCFGHQMLAHTLGGQAEKSDKGWGLGMKKLQVLETQPFMDPPLANGDFYYCHQDQVTTLPAEAQLLAGSEFCPNGMFVIGEKVFALQAHPEFTPGVMDKTITWLRDYLPTPILDNAEASLTPNRRADNEVIAQWILNFLED